MAEPGMVMSGTPTEVVHRRTGMGILRLLRRWPADQVAAGGRTAPWPGAEPQPRPAQGASAPDAAPRSVVDRRATTSALRQTIDDWRRAQRELEELAVGSRDRARAQANVEMLRTRHHRLFTQLARPER